MSREFDDLFKEVFDKSDQKEYLLFHKERFEYIFKIIIDLKVKKILDIGSSGFSNVLQKAHYDLTILNNFQIECNLEIDNIPYPDKTYDLIIYTEVIEHLKNNYQHSLNEIYRIIKPKGYIIFSTPNKHALWKKIFPKMINIEHCTEFTMNESKKMLKKSGFNLITKKYLSYQKKTGLIYKIYFFIVKFIGPWQETIIIVGKKN